MKLGKLLLVFSMVFSLVVFQPDLLGKTYAAGVSYESGDSDPGVLVMKKKLYRLGYTKGIEFTNYYGYSTSLRVKDFQGDYGLSKTGVADDKTLSKLNSVIDSKFRVGRFSTLVQEFKEDLDRVGFGNGMLLDKYYGEGTAKNVREFQNYYDLSVTGNANYKTIEKLDEILASPLQSGEKNQDVLVLKRVLYRLGYTQGIAFTTTYGYSTGLRVEDFQRDHNLPVSGIADYKTLEKLNQVVTSELRVGKKSDLVQGFKVDLDRAGFGGDMLLDKYYGSGTAKMVREFQSFYGLTVTGNANYETLKKLDEILASPLQSGASSKDVLVMKKKLVRFGYKSGIEYTNYFGYSVGLRVKDFQRDHNLPASGIADDLTLKTLNNVIDDTFKVGEKSSLVQEFKTDLARVGFGENMLLDQYYGSGTAKSVKEFQTYYGLSVTGNAGYKTIEKLDEVLATPMQVGYQHKDVLTLKNYLVKLGYGANLELTNYFDETTEARLKEFQRDNDLPPSGMGDDKTMALLEKLANQGPEYRYTYSNFTFQQALDKQMALRYLAPQTDLYRNDPAYVWKSYFDITESGIITENGVRLRSAPNFNNNVRYQVNSGTRVTILGTVDGALHAGSTKWYKISYKNETLYVHTSLANPNGKIATAKFDGINIREKASTSSHIYGSMNTGTSVAVLQELTNWIKIDFKVTWRNAKREDVSRYLDPAQNDEFQHLVLSESVNLPATELNRVLINKGVLEGMGQAFIDAGKEHSVNEIYLISHALLETGHGDSDLAMGIEVGLNAKGVPTLVTSSNRGSLTKIETVHNMYGIGANDSDPERLGAIYAYNAGWFSPRLAIIGGAEFISGDYLEVGQDTLYKMRWNPVNPATHQYASDIQWTTKQLSQIKSLYGQLHNPKLIFDIPVYKK